MGLTCLPGAGRRSRGHPPSAAMRRVLRALFVLCLTASVLGGQVFFSDQGQLIEVTPKIDWTLFNCRLRLYEPCETNKDIFYYLYTSEDRQPEVLNGSYTELPHYYNSSLPLKVTIHGFAGGVEEDPTHEIRKAYMKAGGYNVLSVDWGRLAMLPCYPPAALNTIEVSRCLGQLLVKLCPHHPPHSLHLIGFSLGAHIAAYTSNYLNIALGESAGRITGLDPALPYFATLKDSWKLDKGDAEFVDVIHTNVGYFGKLEPTGHVDFYVNGGTHQPNCAEHKNPPLCSHFLANTYFAESISSEVGFWGSPCQNYFYYALGWCPVVYAGQDPASNRELMGEHVSHRATGVYFVLTDNKPPYAMIPTGQPTIDSVGLILL